MSTELVKASSDKIVAALQVLVERALIVWECELRRPEAIFGKTLSFLRTRH